MSINRLETHLRTSSLRSLAARLLSLCVLIELISPSTNRTRFVRCAGHQCQPLRVRAV
jgi:hypothetical protein